MLLIIFLGLIAKLALVLGDCKLGPPTLQDFDYNRFIGSWYPLKHQQNVDENNFDCVRGTFAVPEGDRSLLVFDLHDKIAQGKKKYNGYVPNWNSTGYFEVFNSFPLWSGIVKVIAIDYDRYIIFYICRHGTEEMVLYVAYRSPHPDQETVNEVNRQMQDKYVDASQLVDWSAHNCSQAESSAASGISA